LFYDVQVGSPETAVDDKSEGHVGSFGLGAVKDECWILTKRLEKLDD
jgi:hypothetical protein